MPFSTKSGRRRSVGVPYPCHEPCFSAVLWRDLGLQHKPAVELPASYLVLLPLNNHTRNTVVIKRYRAPEPPVVRALAHAAVSDVDKSRLRAMLAEADPVLLLARFRASQAELGKRVDERGLVAGRAETPAPLDLALFTASLKVAWADREQQPTHRRCYVRVKLIVRPSMLDAVRDQLLAWLEAQPALTAAAALDRLRQLHPDRFTAEHLRTMQRFIKARRLTRAREVLLGLLPAPTGLMAAATGDDGAIPGGKRHENARSQSVVRQHGGWVPDVA